MQVAPPFITFSMCVCFPPFIVVMRWSTTIFRKYLINLIYFSRHLTGYTKNGQPAAREALSGASKQIAQALTRRQTTHTHNFRSRHAFNQSLTNYIIHFCVKAFVCTTVFFSLSLFIWAENHGTKRIKGGEMWIVDGGWRGERQNGKEDEKKCPKRKMILWAMSMTLLKNY